MSNKPRNEWISYGLRFFIYFVLLMVASIAFMDLPAGRLGQWVQLGLVITKAVAVLLPISSFAFCLYGLFKLDKTKESGVAEAIGIVILLGVYGVYVIYNYAV